MGSYSGSNHNFCWKFYFWKFYFGFSDPIYLVSGTRDNLPRRDNYTKNLNPADQVKIGPT